MGIYSSPECLEIDMGTFDFEYHFITMPTTYLREAKSKDVFILNIIDLNSARIIYIREIDKNKTHQYILNLYGNSCNNNYNNINLIRLCKKLGKSEKIIIERYTGVVFSDRLTKIVNIILSKFEKSIINRGLGQCQLKSISNTKKSEILRYVYLTSSTQ